MLTVDQITKLIFWNWGAKNQWTKTPFICIEVPGPEEVPIIHLDPCDEEMFNRVVEAIEPYFILVPLAEESQIATGVLGASVSYRLTRVIGSRDGLRMTQDQLNYYIQGFNFFVMVS